MANSYIFSSESVGEGHPDKVCDTISDAILDACLAQDRHSRVACETFVKSNIVCVGGEITTRAKFDYEAVIRAAIRGIGYVNDDDIFHADKVFINNYLTAQSADIAQGVDAKAAAGKATAEQGAGDQGLMFGYACKETPSLLPAPIHYSHEILKHLRSIRDKNLDILGPDSKSQVSIVYENNIPKFIDKVVVSTQHSVNENNSARELAETAIHEACGELINNNTEFFINPTGNFVIGGPEGDSGITGRKIIVDTYGGYAPHGGGAFSGKDPSKVDRSAAYAGRYVAKNIVAAGLAKRCEIQVSYAIGVAEPTSISIDTFGTGVVDEKTLVALVREHFDLRPYGLIQMLDLERPIYRPTAAYGHFGRDEFPWEATDKADALRASV